MGTRGYEAFDTTAWPDAGPITTEFAGTAGRFGDLLVGYEACEDDEWEFPWARFDVPSGGDANVEEFIGDPNKGGDPYEFWEDQWVRTKAHPEDDVKIVWTLVGEDDFSTGW